MRYPAARSASIAAAATGGRVTTATVEQQPMPGRPAPAAGGAARP